MALEGDQTTPGGHRVFISYASDDRPRIEAVVAALTVQGCQVWWDRHIAGGAAFAREIEAALRDAEAVVVAWSAASIESDWVRDEATLARELGHLVPVRLDKSPPPLGFGQYQLIDLSTWDGNAEAHEIKRLIAAIERAAAAQPGAYGARASPSAPDSARRFDRRALIRAASRSSRPQASPGGWSIISRHPAKLARTIAVLPFANLSGDPAQDYFSDGLSEELVNALARLGQLQVVARTSSFKFKGAKEDSHAIGAKLGVACLLDGSVRRSGDKVRVGAQLVDAATGFERWSQTYDRDLKDILAVQAGIAQAVADALKVQLLGGDLASLSRGATSNPAAYDAYLQGRRLYNTGGVEANYRNALGRFDAAIAADPSFAAAHAARANVLVTLGDEFVGPDQLHATYDAARVSANDAVELAPTLADAQIAMARALSAVLDFAGARRAYTRAMAWGSGRADVLAAYGLFTCNLGEFGAGLAAARKATILDPLNAHVFKSLGFGFLAARRYAEAIIAMRHALQLSPGTNGAHFTIGEALQLQGQLKAARAEYAIEPVPWLRQTGEAIVLHQLGDAAGAQAALTALQAGTHDVTFYQQAQIFAQWGQTERAFAAMDAAAKAGDSGLIQVKQDRMLKSLHVDRRYDDLIARLGLVE